eukprot:Opistho-2@78073
MSDPERPSVGTVAVSVDDFGGASRNSSSPSASVRDAREKAAYEEAIEMSEIRMHEDTMNSEVQRELSNAVKGGLVGVGAVPAGSDEDLRNLHSKKPTRSAFERANPLSRMTFWWMNPLISRARRGKLVDDDFELCDSEEAQFCYDQFSQHWDEELKRPEPSLLRALRKTFWKDFVIAGIFKLFWGAFMILAAFYFVLFLVKNVKNFNNPNYPQWQGFILATFFSVTCFCMSVSLQQMTSRCSQVGIRVRGAVMTAIYRKSLRTEGVSNKVGDVITLVSNDCSRLHEGCTNFHFLWSGPIESFTIVGLVFYQTGISALPGLIIMIAVVPLQYGLALLVTRARRKNIKITDVRVQIMQEILQAIKLVKFYAWERSFAKQVKTLRKKERYYLQKIANYKTIHLMIVFIIPPILVLAIFAVYVLWTGHILESDTSFTVLSLFNSLRFPLVVLPVALKNASDTLSALRRIGRFLQSAEIQPLERGETAAIEFHDASITYPKREDEKLDAEEIETLKELNEPGRGIVDDTSDFKLSGINFAMKPGQLMAVVGPVGCGKTSIINAILGEAVVSTGSMKVGGRLAYVPQTSWIQQMSVRDNILFGSKFDRERYDRVIHACALSRDLEILAQGDMTEIGEGGINLSGGQRQRISLARAVYSNAEVFPSGRTPQRRRPAYVQPHFRALHQGPSRGQTRHSGDAPTAPPLRVRHCGDCQGLCHGVLRPLQRREHFKAHERRRSADCRGRKPPPQDT